MVIISVAGCESLVDIPSGWICVPIKGSMSANFVGAELDAQAVENYLIHYIEREIDSEDVRVNGIQEVVFLVQTADVGAPSTGDTTSRTREAERNDGRATHVALASSLSIAFVLVVLVLFAVMRRRRLSTKDYPTVLVREIDEAQLEGKENLVSGDSGDADDSEVDFPSYTQSSSGGDGDGATQRMDTQLDVENPPQLLRSSTATTLPTSNVKSLVPATSSMTTLPTTNKTGHQSPASPQLSPTTSVGDSRASATAVPTCFSLDAPAILSDIAGSEEEKTKAVVVDGSSTNSGSALSTTPLPALADVLPPKPPGAASAKPPAGTSKTIKVTRKKKKKKKKPSLIRVNSRESMNEMETITEENDEEKNSDCSEYSWCSTDDEDSSRPGSRDPSPARSNPRSRDPSPSRSNPRSRDASPSTRSRGSNNNNSGSSLDLINNSSSSSLDSSQMLTTIDVPASSSSFDDKESGGTKKNRLPAWV